MGDPITVLGAIAGSSQIASQLIQSTISIVGFFTKLQEAPETIRRQRAHVEQLQGIATLIISNPALQGVEIASILRSCLATAEELHSLLEKSSTITDTSIERLHRALVSVFNERKVQAAFGRLEGEKASLLLCIQQVDLQALQAIDIQVGEVSTILRDTAHDIKTIIPIINQIPDLSAAISDVQTQLQQTLVSGLSSPTESQTYYDVPNRLANPFIGRDDVLLRIEGEPSRRLSTRVVVLQGMGGQGKSQIALEFCRRKRNNPFSAIFWVDASSEHSLQGSLQSILERLKSPEAILQSREAQISYVLQKLASWHRRWLLVFDNYDDIEAFPNVRDYIPSSELGTVLITSRHADTIELTVGEEDSFIQLHGLEESASVDLFTSQSQHNGKDSDSEHLKEIMNRLGHHPLAITQAAAYFRKRRLRLDDFMEHYKRRKELILKNTPQFSQYKRKLNSSEKETCLSVFTTWDLSYSQLESRGDESRTALRLLTLLAFFDNKNISENIIAAYSDLTRADKTMALLAWMKCFTSPENVWQGDVFEDALILLRDSSLLQSFSRSENGECHASMHPLIKDWIRLRSGKLACQQYAMMAAFLLGAYLESLTEKPDLGFKHLSLHTKQSLVMHTLAQKENYEEYMTLNSGTDHCTELLGDYASMLSCFTIFLLDVGLYADVAFLSQEAMTLTERVHGPESSEAIDTICVRIRAQELLGELNLAEDLSRRALSLAGRLFMPEHSVTLRMMSNLAVLLRRSGELNEAKSLSIRLLDILKRKFGEKNDHTLRVMNELGVIYAHRKELQKAEDIAKRVLQLRQEMLGVNHDETILAMYYLSTTYMHQARYDEAERLMNRSIGLRAQLLGEEHPEVLGIMHALALTYNKQKRHEEAITLMSHVKKMRIKTLGSNHERTLMSRYYLKMWIESMDITSKLKDFNLRLS